MDLALLVYGISLLGPVSNTAGVICFVSGIILIALTIANLTTRFDSYEYSWNLNKDGTLKKSVIEGRNFLKSMWKWALAVFILSGLTLMVVPKEKTAYMMVAAYSAQKIAENGTVQDMSSKVLTIVNQKLDQYVEEGIKDAEERATKATEKVKAKAKKAAKEATE